MHAASVPLPMREMRRKAIETLTAYFPMGSLLPGYGKASRSPRLARTTNRRPSAPPARTRNRGPGLGRQEPRIGRVVEGT